MSYFNGSLYPAAPDTITTVSESEWITGGSGAEASGGGTTQVAIPTPVKVNET